MGLTATPPRKIAAAWKGVLGSSISRTASGKLGLDQYSYYKTMYVMGGVLSEIALHNLSPKHATAGMVRMQWAENNR